MVFRILFLAARRIHEQSPYADFMVSNSLDILYAVCSKKKSCIFFMLRNLNLKLLLKETLLKNKFYFFENMYTKYEHKLLKMLLGFR